MSVKQPFGYYAGKQLLAKKTIEKAFPDLSEIKIFVEPFCGGASLFWHLPDNIPQFILNDNSSQVTRFYRLAKNRDPDLLREVEGTVYSEDDFLRATRIFHRDTDPEGVRAWAFWYLCGASFAYEIGKGFGFNRNGLKGGKGVSGTFYSRRESLGAFCEILDRRNLTIFNRDFADLPTIYDEEGVLYYIDPPYLGTTLGHCGDWTIKDEVRLLRWASTFQKAKIIIAGYLNNDEKIEFATGLDWDVVVLRGSLRARKNGSGKKTEIVLRNFRDK